MNSSRDRSRSPLSRTSDNSNNSVINNLEIENINNHLEMANYTEINIAKEIIPHYEGGSKNLSYFIQQCEKFCNTYKNKTAGQENCTLNKLLFEICCSRLTGAARDTLVISNCLTWDNVKKALISRFGDPRNETLLENDLSTCYQSINENYDQYYEKIKAKLQQLLEHLNISEEDENLKIYKSAAFTQRALETYKAGLLEPYRSFISYKSINSLEDCLIQLRNYDNYKQQVNFLNFMRQKVPLKQNLRQPIPNRNPPPKIPNQQFNTTPFSNQINSTSHASFRNPNYNQNQNKNQFPSGPINIQTRPIQRHFPTNSQVFGNKSQPEPTPMSISTRNTTRSFQNAPNRYNNNFRNPGPQNFITEIHNIEDPENVQLETEMNEDYYEYNEYYQAPEESEEHIENFPTPASQPQTSI